MLWVCPFWGGKHRGYLAIFRKSVSGNFAMISPCLPSLSSLAVGWVTMVPSHGQPQRSQMWDNRTDGKPRCSLHGYMLCHQSCIAFKQGSKFCNSLSKTLGWSDLDCWWGPSKCGYANIIIYTCTSTVWAKVSLLSSSQQLLAPALSTGDWLCKSGWIMMNCRSCIRLASISPHLSSPSLSKRKHLQILHLISLSKNVRNGPTSTHPPYPPIISIIRVQWPLHKSVLLPFWCGRWAKCHSPSHPTNGPWRSRVPVARPRCTRHACRLPALPHPPGGLVLEMSNSTSEI